jgi:ferrous-iron efflux pump FieF
VLSTFFDLRILDPLFGGAVGIWIIWSASRLARLALTQLMDQELPDSERQKIREIALSYPDVSATHGLRTRVAGPPAFIQIHLEMDGAMSLIRAHEISDEVEAKLRAAYPNADIIIHQDPKGVGEVQMIFPEPVSQ